MRSTEQRRKWLRLCAALLLLGAVTLGLLCSGYLYAINLTDKPGKDNHSMLPTPMLERPSGFYDQPFQLAIDVPMGTKVYYTLDCTDPGEDSILYTGPITIEDASLQENQFSTNTDVSAGFYTDLYLNEDPGYCVPDYSLDKCTVIRAIAVSPLGQVSREVTATYFVGIDPQRYDGCNIMSLVTDPDNLFDPTIGIYVTGDIFRDRALPNLSPEEDWRWWDGNYRERGKDWERPAYFMAFDPEGELLWQQGCGIRSQGGRSRSTLPRSLNLYARSSYGGGDRFDYRFFGDEYLPDKLTLSSGGNENITQFNDVMMCSRVKDLNFTSMEYSPYVLFLEGEYWGFYWMASKFDEEYLSYLWGVDPENTVIVKFGDIEYDYVREDMMYALNAEHQDEAEQLENLNKVVEVSSMIDYYAAVMYIARQEDWPVLNTAMWRTAKVRADDYSDRRWRYILYDSNSRSMCTEDIEVNSLTYVLERDEVFAEVWKNSLFRQQFSQRCVEIAEECFPVKEMQQYIDDYTRTMEPALAKSWARFYGTNNEKSEEFHKVMASHREFFTQRPNQVKSWFS